MIVAEEVVIVGVSGSSRFKGNGRCRGKRRRQR